MTSYQAGNALSWTIGARTVTAQSTDPALQCPLVTQSPELLINDVKLSQTGVSVMGQDALGSLEPDYAGKEIALTLTGAFKDSQHQPLFIGDFLFNLIPTLVHQTFIGTEPSARVLLDDSILLEVSSVTAYEIHAILHTEKVPDLYLKGLHRISVEQGNWYTDTLIKVGEPIPPMESLAPEIRSVEVLRDASNIPLNLRLIGKNFMLYPKLFYATIDGEFGFGYQTSVNQNGAMQTIVRVPHPEFFDQQVSHTVILATPFGVSFKGF